MKRDLSTRITRFQAGMSIAEIARQDGVTFHSVYTWLWERGLVDAGYLEREFINACYGAGLPKPEQQHKFAHPHRAFKTDFAFVEQKLAIEIDGGTFQGKGGAHNTDREKRCWYAIMGWRVLYFDNKQLEDPQACVKLVSRCLGINAPSLLEIAVEQAEQRKDKRARAKAWAAKRQNAPGATKKPTATKKAVHSAKKPVSARVGQASGTGGLNFGGG
jgi:transposase-like protein